MSTKINYKKSRAFIRAIEDACVFGVGKDISVSKASKVYKIIKKVLAEGFARDGVLRIEGFGTFYIHTRKAFRLRFPHHGVMRWKDLPPKNFIKFKATRECKRFISAGVEDDGSNEPD